MSWEAANAPKHSNGGGNDGFHSAASLSHHHLPIHQTYHPQHYGVSGDDAQRDARSMSSETVEAALSRLSKAYATSMQCIGSMNKTNQMILRHHPEVQVGGQSNMDEELNDQSSRQPDKISAAIGVVHRVANAARSTLERAILLDPLIIPHVPTLHQCMVEFTKNSSRQTESSSSRWEAVGERRPVPPTISSSAHKSTLIQLAYLSLVNYSDLLQSGRQDRSVSPSTRNSTTSATTQRTILDRGVVPELNSLRLTNNIDDRCCWKSESPEETQRLAVAALCDASNLDASDPTVWLKLACASRTLERIVAQRDGYTTVLRSKHRRLQRHALERGSTALPPHMPPNRTVLRALEEFVQEPEPEEYVSCPLKTIKAVTKTLELPRYSWSILGRMLIRACKGEDAASPWGISTAVTMQTDPSMFGLPMIVMELSPMLILPPRVLGKICQFLPNPSIWKFEATCRALSVSVMAARATMEESENTTGLQGLRQHDQLDQLDRRHEPSGKTREAKPSAESIAGDDQRVDQMNAANYRASSSSSGPLFEEQSSQCETRPIVSVHTRPTTARAEGYRTSQRLRSQQISSGKKQDREANRKSFTYCFLAATMACTKDQHDGMINALRGRKECSHLFDYAKKDTLPSASRDVGKSSSDSSSMFSTSRLEATERVSDASLPSFIDRWNAKNSGPMDVLERFLTHIAVYSEEVFLSDPGGTVGLASCIISSFEVLLLRSGSHRSLTPRFYKSVTETGSVERSIELFGMDLLYAELTLRHCDRYAPKVVEYDDDANLISILVPQLLEDCVDISRTNIAIHHKLQGPLSKFHSFQARCYWLAAGFFLCRSRFAKAAHDSREAEDEGIFFIEEAIRCFDVPNKRSIKVIKTPHLVSPGRQDGYWKEISPWSLAKFRDEIQASSVVSHARQQFQELVSQMEKPSGLGETQTTVSPQDAANLIRIGQKLFERYSSRYGDGNSKLHELIEDFLMLHGDYLLVPRKAVGSSQSTLDVESLSKLIPLEVLPITDLTTMLNPSILTMLVACLNMDLANRAPVAQLLLRLVLTAIDFHGSLLRQVIGSRESLSHVDGYNTDDVSSDTDDDSFMSDDVGRQPSSHKHDDEKKVRQCGHLVKLLVDRLVIIMGSDWHDNHKASLILSDEFRSMVKCTMDLSNRWFQSTVKFLSVPDDSVDQGIFLSIMKILEISKHVVAVPKSLEQLFFRGMVRTIISQRDILEALSNSQGDRASRNARQRLCIQRAKYLGQVASQIGIMLSTNLSTVNEDGVMRGALFSMESGQQRDAFIGTNLSCEEVTVFLHSVRWLQKYISQVDSETSASSAGNVRGTFDRPVIKELRIPISIMLVGLCGGASFSLAESTNEPMFSQGLDGNETLTLLDFFDSDASANDWEPEAKTDQEPHRTTKKDILRVICHAAHCIALVLERTEDKDIVTTCLENFCDPLLGGFLPLVSARVLNFFADTLLLNFGGDDSDGNPRKLLWAEEYSHRTEQIGQLVDTLLHKSYRWLYGFPLVSEHYHQQNPGKELAHASNPISEVAARRFKPQSTAAAAQLYRCVVRAYTGGRRTPPKAALELVASALPPQEESKRSRALREFVFAGDKNYFNLDDVIGLVNQRDGWEVSFSRVRNSILVNEEFSDEGNLCLEAREAMQVRRGLSSRLASGPLPIVSELGRHKETGVDDDRSHTIRQEEEISKKFTAVIDDLSLSDVDKCEGWYRAAQCLTMKADVIADRLGLNLGFSRIKDFSVPTHRFCRPLQLNIFDLESEQGKEEAVSSQIGFLGNDLSVYVSHSWSSFDSLRECAAKTRYPGSEYSRLFRETYSVSYQAVWKKIESQFEKSDYLGWCESWGGIFVNALRRMSLRFMCIALYILRSKESKNSMDKVLMSEISEALGVSIYSELMASQSYGWPMKTLTAKRKRDLSFAARACFESAIDLVENSSTDDDGSEERATWDLLFMVGKCNEKIARTYILEAFPDPLKGDKQKKRRYEEFTASAMEVYSKALSQAKKIEEDGGYLVEQAGGSAHGSTEVLYRLLASRLKCLINAVRSHGDELELAEMEALRLTEKHWNKRPDIGEDELKEKHIRDRVWFVLADIVDGLAQCRQIQPFFHRSVYRHAQALLWAPVLNDPSSRNGSMGMIPATRSFQIRGLNNSTPAANSAEVVMSALFDKKRSQLCAVWVTTSTASSPFQVLNNSTRKYDSLRGKYAAAYIESLHLCNRRSEIETFMKWLYSSKRDLPSYFQASAMAGGGKPSRPHTQDPLLTRDNCARPLLEAGILLSAKRQANRALADVVIHEVSSDSKRAAPETYLKHAFACYLRLNCTVDELKETRAWKYGVDSVREVDALCQAYMALGETSEEFASTHFGDWSGGARKSSIFLAAIDKCKLLFPSLSGTFFSKKTASKAKKGKDHEDVGGNSKRKPGSDGLLSTETTKVSFEVAVPKGLSSGDTFFSSVKVGNADPIKVKLTVPSGTHSTLRFNLEVPKVATESLSKKARLAA